MRSSFIYQTSRLYLAIANRSNWGPPPLLATVSPQTQSAQNIVQSLSQETPPCTFYHSPVLGTLPPSFPLSPSLPQPPSQPQPQSHQTLPAHAPDVGSVFPTGHCATCTCYERDSVLRFLTRSECFMDTSASADPPIHGTLDGDEALQGSITHIIGYHPSGGWPGEWGVVQDGQSDPDT